MKQITLFFALCIAMICSTTSWADDERVIQMNQLPANAQKIIKHHFSELKPAIVQEETDWLDKSYTVSFENGAKIEFDKKGEWTDIKCPHTAVPYGIIPSKIATFVKKHYPTAKIVEIEIDDDSRKYEVELNNDITLKFSRNQELLGLDD